MDVSARMLISVERDGERDQVAVEEPLDIRLDGKPVAVAMRTPCHDEELAFGFLYGERLIFDKVIGRALIEGILPLAGIVLCVSSVASPAGVNE